MTTKSAMVVVPTYNERENLPNLIEAILKQGESFNILVVDDNSPDGTGQIADEYAQKYPGRVFVLHRQEKKGLGQAYVAGFKEALTHQTDYIIQMDADFSHDPNELPKFMPLMEQYDLVIGSRYIDGHISVVNWSLTRLLLSFFASVYVRLITGMKIWDTTGGFKCWKRQVLEQINLDHVQSDGYSFQIEMNWRAYRLNYRIGEMPIIFLDRHSGTSKMTMSIIREAVWRVWALRFGFYKR
ncbi:MAG: polyprenol monophosphomannose synthase [Gemmatimonadetes bacterium]|nr:MAG: polyprenol monophosphomannose synthase [Gemmatimonadota bacterium]